ncbi:hypothetical protein BS17DRAFT_177638 [Gyrodon lividus]|nr:hypothetical protein BS17DRAFT_177638 [Gyrodon lividus]
MSSSKHVESTRAAESSPSLVVICPPCSLFTAPGRKVAKSVTRHAPRPSHIGKNISRTASSSLSISPHRKGTVYHRPNTSLAPRACHAMPRYRYPEEWRALPLHMHIPLSSVSCRPVIAKPESPIRRMSMRPELS